MTLRSIESDSSLWYSNNRRKDGPALPKRYISKSTCYIHTWTNNARSARSVPTFSDITNLALCARLIWLMVPTWYSHYKVAWNVSQFGVPSETFSLVERNEHGNPTRTVVRQKFKISRFLSVFRVPLNATQDACMWILTRNLSHGCP